VLVRLSLRVRLALLVAGTTLPLILFAGWIVYLHHIQDRQRAFDRVLDRTRAVRLVLDTELQSMTAGLQVLTLSRSLANDDFEGFRSNVDAFLSRYPSGANISIAVENGQQVFNSARQGNRELPRAIRETLAEVFRTGAPAFSNLFTGSITGQPIVVIDVPVYRGGRVVYSMSFSPPFAMFQRLIEQQNFGPEWTVAIFDRTGTNVARVPNPQDTVGQKASPSLMAELFRHREAQIHTTSLEGVPLLTAFTRSPVTEWTVAAGIPTALVTAPLWRNLALIACIGAIFLLIGLYFAVRMARTIARGEALQALMVNELNHRVKNTLATVQSIASQSFRNTGDTNVARRKFDARLAALGRAHNILSDERWEGAELREIVEGIFEPLGFKNGDRFRLGGPPLRVAPRTALILSMVLHELATNALKYGAFSTEAGRVQVEWQQITADDPPWVALTWREIDGPPIYATGPKGFGSRLIEQSIIAQLGGKSNVEYAPQGAICRLEFPIY
jgi:two-component sensor histidine kinase